MSDVNADNWNAIFYGEGHMDVQLTNTLYEQRYGKAGTTPGYTNTVDNPASGPNPAAMSAEAYNSTPVYTDAAGTQTALPNQISTGAPTPGPATSQSATTSPTTPPTIQPVVPTNQGQIPTNAQQSPQDLLNEFLESDPDLMLNMVGNHFRDMGASNVFMQWFTNNFRSFWGRYLGYVAEQAANGQIPNLSFKDWVLQFDVNNSFYAAGGAGATGAPAASFANYVSAQGAA